ncbi:MAG: hypothetical protein WD010_09635 [Nitriliruptor sp.]|uniref:hypothetical protein n=1 Tax=Nitriliruptor sp. TaxID=2448056 RepID=UPI0034A0416B
MTHTETIAVTVAIISAAVTVIGLIWQLALYELSGARLQVRLRPAAVLGRWDPLPGAGARSMVSREHSPAPATPPLAAPHRPR